MTTILPELMKNNCCLFTKCQKKARENCGWKCHSSSNRDDVYPKVRSVHGRAFRFAASLWTPPHSAGDAELVCFLLLVWTNCWTNGGAAGDLRNRGPEVTSPSWFRLKLTSLHQFYYLLQRNTLLFMIPFYLYVTDRYNHFLECGLTVVSQAID